MVASSARYHWYFSVTGAGPHVPGLAVSAESTFAAPVIVGVAVVRVPLAMIVVAADARERLV